MSYPVPPVVTLRVVLLSGDPKQLYNHNRNEAMALLHFRDVVKKEIDPNVRVVCVWSLNMVVYAFSIELGDEQDEQLQRILAQTIGFKGVSRRTHQLVQRRTIEDRCCTVGGECVMSTTEDQDKRSIDDYTQNTIDCLSLLSLSPTHRFETVARECSC